MTKPSMRDVVTLGLGLTAGLCSARPCRAQQLTNSSLAVTVQAQDGAFQIATRATTNHAVLKARAGAQIDRQWVRSNEYPQHRAAESSFTDALGAGHQISVTCSGLQGKPDLVYTVQLYDQRPYATVQVEVQNRTGKAVTVEAIRSVEAIGQPVVGIAGPESADRILSDSYSEDWPRLVIYDLGSGPRQMHRGAWSQVIYNRESKQSLFLGALSADRFVTLLHLMYQGAGNDARIESYTVDSTGTTELQKENSLRRAQPDEAIDLSLPLNAGQTMASERVMMATGPDYHSQLLAYGDAIRQLHHARVTAPNLIGWWSWTSYYMAINEGAALTNARWLADNLKSLGYNYFHIDEGYQYARGEYAAPNARLFPHGMRAIGDEVRHLGLTFGIWTAPFEVTNRAWIYDNHKDWLVHTADGKPIPIGAAYGDTLYALDATHPGAQEYMRQTYTTLTREWGVRYIKLDFMDTTSIEGYRYRPDTTALEAQRIGLGVIREAVGEDVLLDKDGSPMLPPVGLVDTGRISADTSHSFQTTKGVAPGVAARFYMNRNYFLNDPDAFNVGAEVPVVRGGRGGAGRGAAQGAGQGAGRGGLSLSEAQASIVLSAVSGGMYEIGDDLPILGAEKDRLDLVKNQDLLNMAKISRAATPVDLLSYDAEDGEPSIFFLREDPRQSILVVFNWTEQPRSHALKLADLGLPANRTFQASDALNNGEAVAVNAGTVRLDNMPQHSVRVIKLIDSAMPAAAPTIAAQVPSEAKVSESIPFSAEAQEAGVPALSYHWDFGDGTTADGPRAAHTYTRNADFTVRLTADGLDGIPARQSFTVKVTGTLAAAGDVLQNRRYTEASGH
ncbi:Glycoside hydrolase/PKD [Candidatus Sulfopaludibacter sp. SbA6]|nr:Glycoside hydrolase/PKD [Candidatus Sulfopaludibacter sp. SbA6]